MTFMVVVKMHTPVEDMSIAFNKGTVKEFTIIVFLQRLHIFHIFIFDSFKEGCPSA